jgi:hypothetical protein
MFDWPGTITSADIRAWRDIGGGGEKQSDATPWGVRGELDEDESEPVESLKDVALRNMSWGNDLLIRGEDCAIGGIAKGWGWGDGGSSTSGAWGDDLGSSATVRCTSGTKAWTFFTCWRAAMVSNIPTATFLASSLASGKSFGLNMNRSTPEIARCNSASDILRLGSSANNPWNTAWTGGGIGKMEVRYSGSFTNSRNVSSDSSARAHGFRPYARFIRITPDDKRQPIERQTEMMGKVPKALITPSGDPHLETKRHSRRLSITDRNCILIHNIRECSELRYQGAGNKKISIPGLI